MRLLLDENVPQPLWHALRTFMVTHSMAHVTELGWSGTKDLDLYRRAADEGFDVILTNDEKQMQRPLEVQAIAASGVQRVQYPHKHSGLLGLGVAIGTVCAGLPLALGALERADTQRLVRLTGLDPTISGRLKITNPAEEPPKFWPEPGTGVPRQAGESRPLDAHVPRTSTARTSYE